ncbi:hypothetical protein DYB37_010078 [Aphanomyces astaci]|uniref:BED-type domain-containing protein n=1 Tax=Aphanomyces astaci TaxID=112090 RepID=A0A3R6XV65_APHAT|nr:hypothetical protein DYB35_007523 [Aphanomyces astaci]RHZ12907.1 hypothetical protein DYB37_010078 [Aphanomyces astaci]
MSTHQDRLRGKPLAMLYFTRTSPGSSVWVCKCGKHRTRNGSGYINLTSHIEREHPEFVHYDALDPATQQSVFASLTPKPVQAVHGWLTWITASLMPFSFCENDMARRFTTLGTISVMKWMHVSLDGKQDIRDAARVVCNRPRDLVALIGDNCSTNRAFTRLDGVPMIGCASHRFNLFIGDVLAEYEDLLVAVNAIMRKLTNIIPSAKLRRLTDLRPKQRN